MNTVMRGISIGFVILAFSSFSEEMPLIFIQHMQGFILLTLAILLWRK